MNKISIINICNSRRYLGHLLRFYRKLLSDNYWKTCFGVESEEFPDDFLKLVVKNFVL